MPYFIMILVAAAALAVLVGVVYVVLGKGGQLARFEADFPPLDLPEERPVGSSDLGGLLLPLALWGYHVRAVDGLLLRLTATLRDREERIEDLEWRLARLDPSYVPQGTGPAPGSYLPGDAPVEQRGDAPVEQRQWGVSAPEETPGAVAEAVPESPSHSGAEAADTVVDPAEYAPRDEDATVSGGEREDRS